MGLNFELIFCFSFFRVMDFQMEMQRVSFCAAQVSPLKFLLFEALFLDDNFV